MLCKGRFVEELSDNDDDDWTLIAISVKWQISEAYELIQINRVSASSLYGERKTQPHQSSGFPID